MRELKGEVNASIFDYLPATVMLLACLLLAGCSTVGNNT
jgi:hypothetical protein